MVNKKPVDMKPGDTALLQDAFFPVNRVVKFLLFPSQLPVLLLWSRNVEETTAQLQSDKPHKLTGRQKSIVLSCNICYWAVNCLGKQQELCIRSSTAWVQHKPQITTCNARRRQEWCKAHRRWTLREWKRVVWSDESRFSFWQSGFGGRRTLPAWTH